MTVTTNNIEATIAVYEDRIQHYQEIIEKFREQLGQNPQYALEWADASFLAAARITRSTHLMTVLKNVCEQEAPFTSKDRNSLMKSLDCQFTMEIRQATVSDSTSSSQRLMNLARSEVATDWFADEFSNSFGRSFIYELLTDALQEVD